MSWVKVEYSGQASHVIGCDRIGISVFRVRQRHTLTCAAARTVVFVWGEFKTPTHHPCILHVLFFLYSLFRLRLSF